MVTRDITSRKEAEERERLLTHDHAAREWATDTLESISDAFYAVDGEWRFTYVNGKAEELWGRSREELLGKNIWEEFPRRWAPNPTGRYSGLWRRASPPSLRPYPRSSALGWRGGPT